MHPFVLVAIMAAAVISTKAVLKEMSCQLGILHSSLVATCHKEIGLPLLTYLVLPT